MTPVDPTETIEHLARRLRRRGVAHPVAGAVALAARGSARRDPVEFAAMIGCSAETVAAGEAGSIAFGELDPEIGLLAATAGADLMVLADLEQAWRGSPPGMAV